MPFYMFNKYQNVFRSRWKALWWAAGVLMTAYCTVPSANQTDSTAQASHPKPHVHTDAWGNKLTN